MDSRFPVLSRAWQIHFSLLLRRRLFEGSLIQAELKMYLLVVGHIPVEVFLLANFETTHTSNMIFFVTDGFSLINGCLFFSSSIEHLQTLK